MGGGLSGVLTALQLDASGKRVTLIERAARLGGRIQTVRLEPGVQFDFVPPGRPIPRDCDLVILFGSKSTIGDLHFLRQQGWDHDIIAHARNGGRVLGICGGYQMLGRSIADPDGNDGESGKTDGLGLLDVETRMGSDKTVRPVGATCISSGEHVSGYEIHVGATTGGDTKRPMFRINGRDEGASSADGKIRGTYIHGLMQSNAYRRSFLAEFGHQGSEFDYAASVDEAGAGSRPGTS